MPSVSRLPHSASGGCTLYFPGGKVYASDMLGRLIAVASVHKGQGGLDYSFEDSKDDRATCPDVESLLRAISGSLNRARLTALIKQQPNLALADVFDLKSGPNFYYVPQDASSDDAPVR